MGRCGTTRQIQKNLTHYAHAKGAQYKRPFLNRTTLEFNNQSKFEIMQELTAYEEQRLNEEFDNLMKWQHKNKGFKVEKSAVSPNLVKNWKRTDFCQMHRIFDLCDNGDEVFDLMQHVCDIQNARQCGKKGGFMYTPQFGGLYVEELTDDDHKTEFPMWLVEIIEKPTHLIVIVTSKYW